MKVLWIPILGLALLAHFSTADKRALDLLAKFITGDIDITADKDALTFLENFRTDDKNKTDTQKLTGELYRIAYIPEICLHG